MGMRTSDNNNSISNLPKKRQVKTKNIDAERTGDWEKNHHVKIEIPEYIFNRHDNERV